MSSLVWAIKFKLKNPNNASSYVEEVVDGTTIIWIENLEPSGQFNYGTFKDVMRRVAHKFKKQDIIGMDKPVYAGCNPDIVYHIVAVILASNKSFNNFLIFLP